MDYRRMTCGKIKSLSIIYLTECLSPLLTALSFNLILVTFLIEQNGHQKEFFGNVFCTEWLVKEKDVLLDFISSQYRLFDTDLDINILEIFELLVQQFKCECICQLCHNWSSQGLDEKTNIVHQVPIPLHAPCYNKVPKDEFWANCITTLYHFPQLIFLLQQELNLCSVQFKLV